LSWHNMCEQAYAHRRSCPEVGFTIRLSKRSPANERAARRRRPPDITASSASPSNNLTPVNQRLARPPHVARAAFSGVPPTVYTRACLRRSTGQFCASGAILCNPTVAWLIIGLCHVCRLWCISVGAPHDLSYLVGRTKKATKSRHISTSAYALSTHIR